MNRLALVLAFAMSFTLAVAPRAAAWDEPILTDHGLIFPEGAGIPEFLTTNERIWLKTHPLTAAPDRDGPPSGPVHCVAEYEPMEGILISWESFTGILKQIARNVTTVADSTVYVVVDSTGEQSSVSSTLSGYGVDMSRVKFVVRQTDTVWIRDYGPRYIYEGDCRAIVDHTYNRPRPNDDAFNAYFATYQHHAIYSLPLVHGGGNYHLNALDEGNATRLICNENPGLSDQQIIDLWHDYQNVNTTLWTPFPQSVDSTQHIDMWMQIVGDRTIMISDWPYDAGSTQDNICDDAAADFAARGWTVYRLPARLSGWTHYTYTNMILCNNLALIPSYTNFPDHNAEALATYQLALPGHTVVQINCDAIIGYAGALHCICMHVPAPRGGENPTAYLKNYRGGETLDPGQTVAIRWISDDNRAVTSVDLLLSTDGGDTFDTTIVAGTADDGSYSWTVPDVYTTHARLRVVVHDADGNTGFDQSDSDLTINGTPPCPEDLDGDGSVNLADLSIMLAAYGSCAGDANFEPAADLDADGCVALGDLSMLLAAYGTTCP